VICHRCYSVQQAIMFPNPGSVCEFINVTSQGRVVYIGLHAFVPEDILFVRARNHSCW
jgi:hypothetical protein